MNTPAPGDIPDNEISPLEDEAGIPSVVRAPSIAVSRKGIFAVAFMALSLILVSAFAINKFFSSGKGTDPTANRLGDRPAAAAGDARRLDMTLPPAQPASAARTIPQILPTDADRSAEPIPMVPSQPAKPSPEDAPVLLLSSRPGASAPQGSERPTARSAGGMDGTDSLAETRRSLEKYQRQLQGTLGSITGNASVPLKPTDHADASSSASAASEPSLFGGELPKSSTPRVTAQLLGDRNLILPKGTTFTCALETKIISAASGLVNCLVQRDVYSDNGKVLLVERGSQMNGEYRIASVKPGSVRIPVIWTRIRSPLGVTVDIDSPGTGPLGEGGIDGFVDNRWPERIGAAMLLSLINDSVKLAIDARSNEGTGNTVIFPASTSNSSKLAEKVLDSTINIPPLIYQNQGGIVGIYVARDVDFSSVYRLKATQR